MSAPLPKSNGHFQNQDSNRTGSLLSLGASAQGLTQEEKDEYSHFVESIYRKQYDDVHRYGGRQVAESFIQELFSILFAGYFSELTFRDLAQVEDSLSFFFLGAKKKLSPYLTLREEKSIQPSLNANDLIYELKRSLPRIYELIWEDAAAAHAGDPAAESIKEVVLAYSGFYAIAVHRVSHVLYELGVPIFPRMLSGYAHEKTGIDIHPGAKIGGSFFMDHGTGIVIGGTTTISDNVKIYQGVTLGALSVSKDLAKVKRHPTIEENVVIYSGATILGGDTVIGKNTIIGGNAWVTHSIPPYSIVYQKSEVRVRNSQELDNQIDFTI
ncbi:serine O-acetyltransferase EpsC [Leptospira idonii]|uniref:Serine acetyltransferase n=1 Tax=Leptospira idonii TaxID=1193500 RepID=A0A4R9LXI9_9LEPT|nr:serine O-acetyltransferase EpsC [Leptospira idonii]TGN19033.1 serine acetyltransferase [Leptospira idonii]